MHIVINQSNNVFGIDAENKIFAQSTETITFDVTFNDPQATLQGLYCALLSDCGKTLALATISENKAVLDTNTIECVEYVAQWSIGTTRHAFLVVGESTKPLAIIDVEVSQNPLEGLMPPTESAPSYPTSAELQAILAEVNAQAQSASRSAKSANQDAIFVNTAKAEVVRIGAQVTTDKALIQGYASTASSGASRAEEAKRIAVNASEYVSDMQVEIGATKTKIDATAKVVQANADAVAGAKKEIDTAISTANTAINEAVERAETAKGDAVKAQAEASKSAEQASTSASNAATSATNAKTSEDNAKASADELKSSTGAIKALEDGRGAYKDPATGKVYFYTPCPVGDGTLVQLQTTGGIDRITLVEGLPKSAGISISQVSGDDFVIFCDGNTYVYDKTFKRIGKVGGAYVLTMYRDGFVYRILDTKVQKRNVNGTNVGDADATVDTSMYNYNFIGYNPKTGHIVAGEWKNNQYIFGIFDTDLNAILDANNEPITKRGTVAVDWGYTPNSNRRIAQVWNTKNVLFFNDVCFGYEAALSCTLFMLDDTDAPVVVHESLPAFDEATGNTILEKDANGNLVKDALCYKPVIATNDDGTPQTIRIKSREQIESSRVSSTAYYNILTPFTDRLGQVYLTNLVDEYVVYADGTIVDKYRYCKDNVESTTPSYSATKRAVKVNDLNNNNGALRLVYANAGTDVSQGGRLETALIAVWSANGCFYTGELRHGSTGGYSLSNARTQNFFVNPSILYQNYSPQTANGARYGLWRDMLFKHNALVRGGSI